MDSMYLDGTYLKNNPDWHAEDSAWKAGHIARILERNGIDPASLCEVGCGAGEILRNLATRYPSTTRFVGYEVSPSAYQLCSAKAKGNLTYKFGSPFDDSLEFDVAMAIDVFEHVEDYFTFLRRMRGKGRYKVFHIPLELSVHNVMRSSPLVEARRKVGHLHHFSRETALAALEDTGYSVIDSFYTSGRTDLGNLGWKSSLLKWPRRITYRLSPDVAARVLGGFSLLVLAR
jgi:SAM-dependent methyltransferase